MVYSIAIPHNIQINNAEIIAALKELPEFNNYTIGYFGLINKKVLVGESLSVGTLIGYSNNQITISPFFGKSIAVLLGIGVSILMAINKKEKEVLQKKVYDALYKKYCG